MLTHKALGWWLAVAAKQKECNIKLATTPRRTLSRFEWLRASLRRGFESVAIKKPAPLVCLAVPLQMWHSKFA